MIRPNKKSRTPLAFEVMNHVRLNDCSVTSAQCTVLLVEDDAPVRLLMSHILEAAGFRVHLATDGFDALRKLSEIGTIDLLLTDLAMPGMTGIELARRATELIPNLKIVYATGSQDCFPETRTDISCVTKPFTVEELLAAVESALNEAAGSPP